MKLTVAALLAFAILAAPAAADQGRALLPTGLHMPLPEPDAFGAQRAVALPDGGAVLVTWSGPQRGIVGVRMRPDGTPDPTFHVRIAAPGHTLAPTGVLRRPDGRLLVSGVELSNTPTGRDELIVAQLTAEGALDPAFGAGGIARTGIAGYSGAALAPNGSVVVTGTDTSRHWVVAHVTEAGVVDRTVEVPGSRTNDYSTRILVAPDGRITVLGGRGRQALAARLLPDLTADPAWAGLVKVPVHAYDIALGPDGSVTALGQTRVARLTPAGAPDTAYGKVDIGNGSFGHLLAEPDGGVLVYNTPAPQPRPTGLPPLVISRLSATGERTTVKPKLRFGGGASMLASRRTTPLRQNGFDIGELVRRPDGSYLAAGGVTLVQYTGEGEGFSSAQHAVVALTAQLKVDRSFGPAFPRASVSVRLGHRTAHGRLLRLRVKASMPGMLAVRVEDRRGRLVASGLAPVHRAGRSTVRIRTRKSHGSPAGFVATFRDLAGETAGVAALP